MYRAATNSCNTASYFFPRYKNIGLTLLINHLIYIKLTKIKKKLLINFTYPNTRCSMIW